MGAEEIAQDIRKIGPTQSLAKEFEPYNINVNAVCPGVVRTPLWDPLLDQLSSKKGISRDEAWAFLASDRAANITASAANVSGGQMIW